MYLRAEDTVGATETVGILEMVAVDISEEREGQRSMIEQGYRKDTRKNSYSHLRLLDTVGALDKVGILDNVGAELTVGAEDVVGLLDNEGE